MLIYIISEEKIIDSDALKNNEYLKKLIKLRIKYKISLLILLTHSDTYYTKINKEDEEWKKTIETNKTNLLENINDLIKNEYKSDFTLEESNILHVVLVEHIQKQMTDQENLDSIPDEDKDLFKDYNEEQKKIAIDAYWKGKESSEKKVLNFIKKQINEKILLGQKEMIETFKEKLPSQYHGALIQIE